MSDIVITNSMTRLGCTNNNPLHLINSIQDIANVKALVQQAYDELDDFGKRLLKNLYPVHSLVQDENGHILVSFHLDGTDVSATIKHSSYQIATDDHYGRMYSTVLEVYPPVDNGELIVVVY